MWYLFDHSWTNYINLWFIGFPLLTSSIVDRRAMMLKRSYCIHDEQNGREVNSECSMCDLIAISYLALTSRALYSDKIRWNVQYPFAGFFFRIKYKCNYLAKFKCVDEFSESSRLYCWIFKTDFGQLHFIFRAYDKVGQKKFHQNTK